MTTVLDTMEYRDYQDEMDTNIYTAWLSHRNVLAVLPTGAGKSVVVSRIIGKTQGSVCVIAHRQELVAQMSLHLARSGIYHNIIASVPVIKAITKLHYLEYGKCFYTNISKVAVAGVDTIIRRDKQLAQWLPTVKLWVIDESHHVVGGDDEFPYSVDKYGKEVIKHDNKWGKAVKMFPNAKGLGVTATPLRLDGKGLGRHASGCFDTMIVGTDMRTLINRGYLTDYKIYAPTTSDFDITTVNTTKSGEYSEKDVNSAVSHSSLVVHDNATVTGDVVKSYLKFAKGKIGITFVPSMDIGEIITKQYNDAGIPAELINAKTPDHIRSMAVRRLASGELKQLVNIDLFGEGFDLPAIEVVSMVRPTQSYGLYVQMFGRALRILAGKMYGIIIDHVGNVARHGLPDAKRIWTLDDQDKRSSGKSEISPVKTCAMCSYTYERFLKCCPDCGYYPEPLERTIEHVDGSLEELSPEFLRQLRGDILTIDRPIDEQVGDYIAGLNPGIKSIHASRHIKSFRKKVEANIDAQRELRTEMAQWAGYPRAEGRTNDEIFKKFYIQYGIDWLSAQSLESIDADKLKEKLDYV